MQVPARTSCGALATHTVDPLSAHTISIRSQKRVIGSLRSACRQLLVLAIQLLTMKNVTVSLEDSQLKRLEQIQEEGRADSRSEALRRFFSDYEELEADYEELNADYEQLVGELESEREKTKQILEQRDENTELVKYVQEERTAEQRWREASITTRLKWRIFGMGDDE